MFGFYFNRSKLKTLPADRDYNFSED